MARTKKEDLSRLRELPPVIALRDNGRKIFLPAGTRIECSNCLRAYDTREPQLFEVSQGCKCKVASCRSRLTFIEGKALTEWVSALGGKKELTNEDVVRRMKERKKKIEDAEKDEEGTKPLSQTTIVADELPHEPPGEVSQEAQKAEVAEVASGSNAMDDRRECGSRFTSQQEVDSDRGSDDDADIGRPAESLSINIQAADASVEAQMEMDENDYKKKLQALNKQFEAQKVMKGPKGEVEQIKKPKITVSLDRNWAEQTGRMIATLEAEIASKIAMDDVPEEITQEIAKQWAIIFWAYKEYMENLAWLQFVFLAVSHIRLVMWAMKTRKEHVDAKKEAAKVVTHKPEPKAQNPEPKEASA